MSPPPVDPDRTTTSLDDVDLAAEDVFIEAFNARDLDMILDLAAEDVETPDQEGEGRAPLSEELQGIRERSPAVILTRGRTDGEPNALAWLPGEDGRWARVSLITFDDAGGLLTLVQIADDLESLDRVEAEDPMGEPLDDEQDWVPMGPGREQRGRRRELARRPAPPRGDARADLVVEAP